jgi:hypothetical protein
MPHRNGLCDVCPSRHAAEGQETTVWTMHVVSRPGKPPIVVTTPRVAVAIAEPADVDRMLEHLTGYGDDAKAEIHKHLEQILEDSRVAPAAD